VLPVLRSNLALADRSMNDFLRRNCSLAIAVEPESVVVQYNRSEIAVIAIDSATLTAYRLDWRQTTGT
jgi:hypothetical protein